MLGRADAYLHASSADGSGLNQWDAAAPAVVALAAGLHVSHLDGTPLVFNGAVRRHRRPAGLPPRARRAACSTRSPPPGAARMTRARPDCSTSSPTTPGSPAIVAAGRSERLDLLDVVATGAMRPFVVAALAADRPSGAGRPVLAVTATSREAEDLAAALRCLLPADEVAEFPAWETLPHERLSPRADTVGRRLAVLRRLAHPARATPTPVRCRSSSRRAARCCSRWSAGSATSSRCALGAGDDAPIDDAGPPPRRGRLHPGRPGREARRVRRARRHPRRLPADRGAPAARGVLGRHRRGDPLVQGRRPAQPRGRASTACGRRRAASCCSPTRCASAPARCSPTTPGWPTCSARSPRASRSRAWSRSRRCSSTAWSCSLDELPAGAHVVRLRPRAGPRPAPPTSSRTSQEFLDGVVGRARAGAVGDGGAPIDLGAAAYRTLGEVREHALATGRPVVDGRRRSASTRRPSTRRRDARRRRRRRRAPGRALPRRHRARGRRRARLAARRLARRRRHRGPRPGRAVRRAAPRRRRRGPARRRRSPRAPEAGVAARHHRLLERRLRRRRPRSSRAHRDRPRRAESLDQGHAPAARRGAATSSTRCSSRPATSSCTSSTASAATSRWSQRTVAGRDPRVPRRRVRRRQARRPGDRLFVPDRPARPGHPLRRRRGAGAAPARRRRLGRRPRAGRARRSSRSRPS